MSRKFQGLWIGLLIIAAASRLTALAWTPLAPDEAQRALAALDAVRGQGWPASAESPLLLMGNATLFWLFGAGDAIARLLPALAGVALVALPLLWRRRLGEVGALAAAGLLTVSPLALLAARRVEPTLLGALGAGLLLSLALLHDDAGLARWRSPLLGCGVTLALLGGPSAWDVALTGVLAALYYFHATRRRPLLADWQRPALWGLAGAVLISVGLGVRWNGWSGPLDGLAAWLTAWHGADFGPLSLGLPLLYEPLALLLAAVGLVYALLRDAPLPRAFSLWAGALLLLLVIRPMAAPTAMAALLLPLALLAGSGVEQLAAPIPHRSYRWLALHVLLEVVLWIPAGLALMTHAARGITLPSALQENPVLQAALLLVGALILIALHALLGTLFSMTLPLPVIWRGVLAGIAVVLLALQISFGTGAAWRHRHTAVEPAVDVITSPDTRLLLRTVAEQSQVRGLRTDITRIALVGLSPEVQAGLRWTLRDYAPDTTLTWSPQAAFVLTSAHGGSAPPDESWVGARFTATVRGPWGRFACQSLNPLLPPDCSQAFSWYLLRAVKTEAATQEVLLWMRP